jgi:hypothetical protein
MQDKELTPKQESIIADLIERSKRIHREIIKSGGNMNLDLENDEAFDSQGSEDGNRTMNELHQSSHIYGIRSNMNSNEMFASSSSGLEGSTRVPTSHESFDIPRYMNSSMSLTRDVSAVSRPNPMPSNDLSIILHQNYDAILNLNNSINTLITQMHRQVRLVLCH